MMLSDGLPGMANPNGRVVVGFDSLVMGSRLIEMESTFWRIFPLPGHVSSHDWEVCSVSVQACQRSLCKTHQVLLVFNAVLTDGCKV